MPPSHTAAPPVPWTRSRASYTLVALALMLTALSTACDRTKPPADETALRVVSEERLPEEPPAKRPTGEGSLWGGEQATQMIERPFLWKVTGASGPVYLLGTIHLGVDARRELPPVVWDSLDASNTFVMEADISQVNPFALGKYIQLPPNESLKAKLEPEVWQGVKELVSGLIPEQILERSQPWYVNILIIQQIFPKTPPMDLTLLGEAKKQGKALGFLETVDGQFKMLSGLPEDYSLKSLTEAVKDEAALREEVASMLSGYRSGDASQLEELIVDNESFKEWPEARDTMLLDRNARWIPAIEGYIKQGDVFVAVGLGHLLGEGSVIDLLEDKGYTVERVNP